MTESFDPKYDETPWSEQMGELTGRFQSLMHHASLCSNEPVDGYDDFMRAAERVIGHVKRHQEKWQPKRPETPVFINPKLEWGT